MNRSSLAGFGRELPPDELSQALAAVGVLVAADGAARHDTDLTTRLSQLVAARSALLPWRLPPDLTELASANAPAAASLAEAWRNAISAHGLLPRLLVDLPGNALADEWLLRALATPAAGLGSVVFHAERAEEDVGFSWPLRLGFLDAVRSAALRGGLATTSWMQELVEVTPLQEQPDILLMPQGLRGALRAALARPGRDRADLAIVLGGIEGTEAALDANLAALRAEIAAGGVVVVDVAAEGQAAFVTSLVENLAHNFAADEALFAAAAQRGVSPPLIVSSRALAESTRISAFLRVIASELEAFPPDQAFVLDDETRWFLNASPAATGPEIAESLRDRIGSLEYPHESTTATWIVRLRRSAESVRRVPPRRMVGAARKAAPPAAAPPPLTAPAPTRAQVPRRPRHLQAEVFGMTAAGTLSRVRDALVRNVSYVFSFMIGEPGVGRAEAGVFDETKLPRSESGHDLTVVFAETPPRGEVGTPQVGSLHLPPEGDSESCTFAIRLAPNATSFEARVTVLFQNRVLETALVEARACSSGEVRGPIDLRLTSLEVDGLESAGRRPAVDGALLFNETGAGGHALTSISGNVAVIASLAGVEKAVAKLQAAIGAYTDLDRGAKRLSTKEMSRLLCAVAHPGRLLWDHLQKALPGPIRTAPRLHLVEGAVGALLPVELLYRAPAPLPDAKPCPGGPPDGERPCNKCPEGLEGRTVVCANQFWGLRTVFEREAHPVDVPAGAVATVRGATGPTSTVRLSSALLATSELVDDGVPKNTKPKELPSAILKGALEEFVGPGKLRKVDTLEQWENAVEKASPGLLVLVVHNTQDELENDAIEVSGQRISYANIEIPHLMAPGGPEPIVLLIGCSTAVAESGALGLVPRLIEKRASAVVATLAPVLGPYAGPATAELVRALAATRKRGAGTLGDALLEVKRALVARGEPIGMALVAYGDASVEL